MKKINKQLTGEVFPTNIKSESHFVGQKKDCRKSTVRINKTTNLREFFFSPITKKELKEKKQLAGEVFHENIKSESDSVRERKTAGSRLGGTKIRFTWEVSGRGASRGGCKEISPRDTIRASEDGNRDAQQRK